MFSSLKEALKTPDKIYRLNLSSQKLKAVPSQLEQFPNLQELDLRDNQLVELGDVLNRSKHLKVLCLSKNKNLELNHYFLL